MKRRKIGWYWCRYGRRWSILWWGGQFWCWGDHTGVITPDEIDERRIVRLKREKKA